VTRRPSFPYIAPFAVFVVLLALAPRLPLSALADQVARVVIMTVVLVLCSRQVIDLRVERWIPSVLIGVFVFVLWIAPDVLIPGYRHHWWFENPVMGVAQTTMPAASQTQAPVLLFRSIRAVLIVPIVEELFWRAWLMRWIIAPDFEKIPLGTYAPAAFWLTALLFACEHGSYWDVGLVTGVIYNWWMVRTRRLGDLILTHAVTNACLSAYVIFAGKWEYWL
jgi:uncharacterized protein